MARADLFEASKRFEPIYMQMSGAGFTLDRARELSSAWIELARALEAPAPRGRLDGSASVAWAAVLPLMVKVMTRPSSQDREVEAPKGTNPTLLQTVNVFPARRVAAERAAAQMGLSEDEIDRLWDAAYHAGACDEATIYGQVKYRQIWADMNKAHCFSESLAWSMARDGAEAAVKKAASEKLGSGRFANGAGECLMALQEARTVLGAGEDPERARGWITEQEARVARAMIMLIELSDIDPAVWIGRQENGRVEKSMGDELGFVKRMFDASEAANKASSLGRSNVKARRIG